MPNPYDNIFEGDDEEKKSPAPKPPLTSFGDDPMPIDDKEPLDEILLSIEQFTKKAEPFSKLLSQVSAIDHKVENNLLRFFFEAPKEGGQESLAEERKYHDLLKAKFEEILSPMRDLGQLHLQTVKHFNRDIDENYYSIEKTDRSIKTEKMMAVDGINLQRKILADATSNLEILEKALMKTEQRIKAYINAGGYNNISAAEYEMIVQKRTRLTNGQLHHFDYSFFDVNLLDKTILSLGIYMKETTSQYLGKLLKAFDVK